MPSMPKTEIEEANRVNIRTESDAPSDRKSNKDTEEPNLPTPKCERQEPMRVNCRSDSELPRCAKFKTDSVDPIRT